MKSSLRTFADALVISTVAALGLAFASTTDWPRWSHLLTLLPAGYLVSRLSGDITFPWWKTIGVVCVFALLGFLGSGPAETRILPLGAIPPVVLIVCLGRSTLKRHFAHG